MGARNCYPPSAAHVGEMVSAGGWEPAAAAAVTGLACYELWNAWNSNAPTLRELGSAVQGDDTHQQLHDADLTVGSLALIVGVSMAVLTKDLTVLILMIFSFGALTLWYHAVLNRNPN